jgi:ABC-2 type transport system ATP-binding protein
MIEARGLTKRYGGRTAVDDLTFRVRPGTVTGFLGPNGAGKSTTMRLILGLDSPTRGRVTVHGRGYAELPAPLGEVGALLEAGSVHPGRSAFRHLMALAHTHGIPRRRVEEVIEQVGLTPTAHKRAGSFSLGMGQRLGIAAALLGDPRLLILDEPINGLDPAGVHEMRGLIGRLAEGERTVLVSSHVLAELEQVCDWLIVIDAGRLVFQGPAAELLERSGASVVVAPEHPDDLDRLSGLLAAAGHESRAGTAHLEIAVDGADARGLAAALNRAAGDGGIVLAELRVSRTSLEDRYLTMVNGGDR